ncbi:MAG: beta-lactamase family protein [Acidimicrobiia bacterium]|nr:beta-lactamase family protein [Acidimicrobiia bacterium]
MSDIRGSVVDDEALAALTERARREVDEGLLPTAQWALAVDGEVVAGETIGEAPAGEDTRFVIFSCTKAVVASAIWQLLAEGSLRLQDRVADLVPEFGSNGKDVITVEQVLLHTSGFPLAPLGPGAWDTREGRLAAFDRWRLNWEPGSRFEYHATSAHWVLAELLERIDGVDHRTAVRRRVLEPLGLERLALGVDATDAADVARVRNVGDPPSAAEWEAVLGIPGFDLGEVTDDALLLFADPANLSVGVPGGGAVSTAADLALFYQALLSNPDELWDPEVLADATDNVRNTFADPQTGVPANRALSIVLAGDDGQAHMRGFGHRTGPRAFGHGGAGGQIAWADPGRGSSFVWLTNGLDRHLIRQWRRTSGIASKAGAATGPDA